MRWSYNRSEVIERLYCKEGSAKRNELVYKIEEAWKNSVGESNIVASQRIQYIALKKLHTMYPEDFMLIVIVTMRERGLLKRELDLTANGLNGLGSLINHWDKQQKDGTGLDFVVEFIGSHHELRQPEYMIGAVVEQVRRIRRGMVPGTNHHLEVTDGLLILADDLLANIVEVGKSNVDDYNVLPNDQLHLFLELQHILNLAKKPHLVKELEKRIVKFLKDLEEAKFALRDYYMWWAIRIMLRSKIRCMETGEARVWEEKRKKIEGSMSKSMKEFVDELRKKNKRTPMLRPLQIAMAPLGDYHRGVAEFLNDPSSIDRGAKKNKGDIQLFAAIVGHPRGMKDNAKLFVNHKSNPVKREDGTCLIGRLNKSIRNAEHASQIVILNNHYLAPVMLVLLGTDLVVRFRWFAALKRAAEYFQVRKNPDDTDIIPASRIGPNDNLVEAERLRRELVGVLGNILRRLRLVLPHQNDPSPIRLMEGWISTLKNLELKEQETIPIKGKDCHLSAMGQLSHACGGFVKWPWSDPWPPGGGNGEGRVVPKERLALELFESDGAAIPTVTISNDKANHYLYYPYVIPVAGLPAAQTKNSLP